MSAPSHPPSITARRLLRPSWKSWPELSTTKLRTSWKPIARIGRVGTPFGTSPTRFNNSVDTLRGIFDEATGEAQSSSARHFAFFIFTSKGVSEAEIGLDKVVVSQIWEVITKFAENPNIGSKAVFESAADMPEHLAATRKFVL